MTHGETIGTFFGVGDVTAAKLKALGLRPGQTDLKLLSLDRLQAIFGKRGTQLYRFACGESPL